MSTCPEALYGQHGEANTSGKCPYCGHHLGRERTGRTTGSMRDDELAWTSWSRREPVKKYAEQDPLSVDPEPDDDFDPTEDRQDPWFTV